MEKLGSLKRIRLSGFKSIKTMDLELSALNVLIGANGAGKSNFIGFFRFVRAIQNRMLQLYVSKKGAAESFLHFGSKETAEIKMQLSFDSVGYDAVLVPTLGDELVFKSEEAIRSDEQVGRAVYTLAFSGAKETGLPPVPRDNGTANQLSKHISDWQIFHFHDTSDTAGIKKLCNINYNRWLQTNGENLAAYLYSAKETPEYEKIVQTIQRVAPFFHDFILNPDKNDPEKIRLCWRHKEYPDAYFDANSLSDGTLRFMCLATLLIPIPTEPTLLLLDEPELGLHPYAVQLLGAMLRSASTKTQIIVSTQSVTLANQFGWEDIIVVEQKDGASSFQRLKEENVKIWLDEYKMGDLWEKNLIGGTP